MNPTIDWDRPEHIARAVEADDFAISGDYLTEVNLFCPVCPNGLGIVTHTSNNPPTIGELRNWADDHIREYHA